MKYNTSTQLYSSSQSLSWDGISIQNHKSMTIKNKHEMKTGGGTPVQQHNAHRAPRSSTDDDT